MHSVLVARAIKHELFALLVKKPPNLQPLHLVEVKIIKYEETVSTG